MHGVRCAAAEFANPCGSTTEVTDDLDTLFCSKTVAVCYKHAGLLPSSTDAADIFPKHFSAPFDGHMNYQLGARLGPHVDISFEPPALRKASLMLRGVISLDRRAQAALRVQSAYRKHLARRLLKLKRRQSCCKAAQVRVSARLQRACCWTVAQHRTAKQLKMLAATQHPLARGLLHDLVRDRHQRRGAKRV